MQQYFCGGTGVWESRTLLAPFPHFHFTTVRELARRPAQNLYAQMIPSYGLDWDKYSHVREKTPFFQAFFVWKSDPFMISVNKT